MRADWKEIRAHFQLHAVDSRMQRYENIRTLSAMRKTLEMQLLKRDQETGEQWLDKNNAESIMKVIAASSRDGLAMRMRAAPRECAGEVGPATTARGRRTTNERRNE